MTPHSTCPPHSPVQLPYYLLPLHMLQLHPRQGPPPVSALQTCPGAVSVTPLPPPTHTLSMCSHDSRYSTTPEYQSGSWLLLLHSTLGMSGTAQRLALDCFSTAPHSNVIGNVCTSKENVTFDKISPQPPMCVWLLCVHVMCPTTPQVQHNPRLLTAAAQPAQLHVLSERAACQTLTTQAPRQPHKNDHSTLTPNNTR